MPSIIEELILQLFNGTMNKRDVIVNKVLDYHIANGGLPPEAQDFPRSVKKALSSMVSKGWATNKAYGMWEILKDDSPQNNDEEIEEGTVEITEIPAHTIYGEGSYAIYLYYFQSYRKLAEFEGSTSWPCKIGRSERDPLVRILSQSSTALPEKPVIEFIIRTDDSSLLETMIHSVLKIRGKQIKESPGTEWFDTSPDEVLQIVRNANEGILGVPGTPHTILDQNKRRKGI